ncbi:MAG: 5-oxoprolinase subunit PxpA [Synergistaceae bacterium]|nr:5-oxoprolinase subunit PxpA [Synergistaceae bacterium]
MYSIDLNSDMGESFGAYKIGNDSEIIKYVTSSNVACGYHAGDPMVMDNVVKLAKEHGVAVGAHPGYPDLMGFGRRKMVLSFMEVKNYMKYQIGALWAFATSYGMKLQHVAPHGALGNLCQYDREVSKAICEAVYEIDPSIMIFYCAGAVLGDEAEKMGLKTASEIFADRAYMDDLSLVPRKQPGSMITDEDLAVERCIRMVKEGKVKTINGNDVDIKGDTLCVHGDGAKALAFVERIRKEFTRENIAIKNFSN